MPKVAYNACYGGFSLSRAAVLRAREISGNPKWGGTCIKGDVFGDNGGVCDTDYGHVEDLPRHDNVLVQVIEELGEAANGSCAKLRLEELPSGTAYRIDEYDGHESVATNDTYNWTVLP